MHTGDESQRENYPAKLLLPTLRLGLPEADGIALRVREPRESACGDCDRWDQCLSPKCGHLVEICLHVVHLNVEMREGVGFVTKRCDVTGHRATGIDHCGWPVWR